MKPKNTRRKTAPTLSAGGSGQRLNTCCEYFKVKKSLALSVDSRELTALEAGQETCDSSVTADKTKVRDVTLLRPRRLRHDSLKQSQVKHPASSGLCIEDVQMLVEAQGSYDGGVNCNVCGKLYKSKVCFIKHIWEHTIYWDVFDKAKNHERVLSIQAAIILYSGMASQTNRASNSDLCNLLVTSPHSSETKQERDSGVTANNDQLKNGFLALLSEKCAEKSPLVLQNGNGKSNDNTGENLLLSGASKYAQVGEHNTSSAQVVTEKLQNTSSAQIGAAELQTTCSALVGAAKLHNTSSGNYVQTPLICCSEYWRQPSFIGYLQSDVLTLPTSQAHSTFSTTTKLQTYPAVFFSPAKRNFYPAEIFPNRPHSYPVGISPAKAPSSPTEISPAKPHSSPTEILPARPHSYPAEKSLARPLSYSDTISPLTKPQYTFDISPPSKPQINPTKFSPHKKPQSCSTLAPSPPQQQMFPIFSSPLPKPQIYPTSTSVSVPVLMPATSLPASHLSSDAYQGFKNSRHPSNDAYGTLGSNEVSFGSPLKRKRED